MIGQFFIELWDAFRDVTQVTEPFPGLGYTAVKGDDRMVEQVFRFTEGHKVERVIQDENIHYLHMVFQKNEGLPEHFSNANLYMTVLRGTLSIGLNDQEIHEYGAGTVLKIPFQTRMNVGNRHDDTLELIVVKAPAPK